MVAKAFREYLVLLAALWAMALLWAGVSHQQLSLPADIRFSDFTIFDARFRVWQHATTAFFDAPGFPFEYPAPTLAAFLAFWRFTPNACLSYLLVVCLFAFGTAGYLGYQYRRLRLILAASLLGSFPLFFLLDRANIEGAVWIVASCGVAAYWTQRFRAAAILLGLSAAMKIFPGLLLLLFFRNRRYRHFGLSLASAALFTIASLTVAGPSPAIVFGGLAIGLAYFKQHVILEYYGYLAGFDHSFFSLLKQMLHVVLRGAALHSALASVYLPYLAVAAAGCLVLWWGKIRHLPALNQLFALVTLSITLPFVSFDYTLVHLYIPFVALLIALSTGRLHLSLSEARSFLLPCAVIFAPLTWLHFGVVGFGAQVKTLALLLVLRAALKIPLNRVSFPSVLPLYVSEWRAETVS